MVLRFGGPGWDSSIASRHVIWCPCRLRWSAFVVCLLVMPSWVSLLSTWSCSFCLMKRDEKTSLKQWRWSYPKRLLVSPNAFRLSLASRSVNAFRGASGFCEKRRNEAISEGCFCLYCLGSHRGSKRLDLFINFMLRICGLISRFKLREALRREELRKFFKFQWLSIGNFPV